MQTTEESHNVGMKLTGYDFWKNTLKGAQLVVAPMVDQSELAWRLLSRRHGAQLCYTPMLNSHIFLQHAIYRRREFQTHPEDHPLIAQFCGDDPETVVAAAKHVENQVEAIDLNLGCPQNIARKGHYGSYLQDEWNLVRDIISSMHRELAVPVTAKIRIFPEIDKTIRYAQMVEEAGAQIITVHGRIREQRGEKTGLADWEQIRLVKEALQVPVFANGNLLFYDDIERCMQITQADGVMTAEGNLYNPCIFEGEYPLVWNIVDEYLNICRTEAVTSLTAVRGHLFKLYRSSLEGFPDHRQRLGVARSFEEICSVAAEMNEILRIRYHNADKVARLPPRNHSNSGVSSPEWFCRSYIRDRTLFNQVYPLTDSLLDGNSPPKDSLDGDLFTPLAKLRKTKPSSIDPLTALPLSESEAIKVSSN